MKAKAMVAKINPDNSLMVVFTEDRRFVNLPLPDNPPPLGSTIQVDLPSEKNSLKGLLSTKWLAVAAMLMVVLAIGMFSTLGVSPVAAYVNLDMKPSLQLSVDDQGKVKGITALNDEGKKLINKIDADNQDLYGLTGEIVQKADQLGYLDGQKDNLVMVSVTKVKDSANSQIDENKLRTVIHDQLSAKRYPGYVVVNETDMDHWQRAQKSGYSVNQLLISEQAKTKGIAIDPQAMQKQDYMEAMKNSHTSVPMLFPENSCEVTWANKNSTVGETKTYSNQAPTNGGTPKWSGNQQWQNNQNWKSQQQQQNWQPQQQGGHQTPAPQHMQEDQTNRSNQWQEDSQGNWQGDENWRDQESRERSYGQKSRSNW
ncbi:anti-sigma-I factor RsgI family protein [Desulfotomaculum nigrificans]|uniref:anti-sigma-I factor RsgI family protein n=1 Tax=Desulfotomaculum nigrificans TaxID=1565 RepID=UPI0001FAE77F|nr:hypothetical protein [Desulfotomaculum nigrificans]MDA8235899.1 hypothetical protein [Clostridia bacterium]